MSVDESGQRTSSQDDIESQSPSGESESPILVTTPAGSDNSNAHRSSASVTRHRHTSSESPRSSQLSSGVAPSSSSSVYSDRRSLLHSSVPHRQGSRERSIEQSMWKLWQREFYSFIFSRLGMSLITLGTVSIVYQLLWFLLALITAQDSSVFLDAASDESGGSTVWSKSGTPFCRHCSAFDFSDNLRGIPMETAMCYEPIDLVYTWVNGSDPTMLAELQKYKSKHLIQQNLMLDPNWTQPVGLQFDLLVSGLSLSQLISRQRTEADNEPNRKRMKSIVSIAEESMNSDDFNPISDELDRLLQSIAVQHSDLVSQRPTKPPSQNADSSSSSLSTNNEGESDVSSANANASDSSPTGQPTVSPTLRPTVPHYWTGIVKKQVQVYDQRTLNCLSSTERSELGEYLRLKEEHKDDEEDDPKENSDNGSDEGMGAEDGSESEGDSRTNVTRATGKPSSAPTQKAWLKNEEFESRLNSSSVCLKIRVEIQCADHFAALNETLPLMNYLRESDLLWHNFTKSVSEKWKNGYEDKKHGILRFQSADSDNAKKEIGALNHFSFPHSKYSLNLRSDGVGSTKKSGELMTTQIDIPGLNITRIEQETERMNRIVHLNQSRNTNNDSTVNGNSSSSSNSSSLISQSKSNSTGIERKTIEIQTQMLVDLKESKFLRKNEIVIANVSDEKTGGKGRYRDNEELRYSLRSVWKYAPWVRNIYIVTNGQIPYWLNLDHPRLFIVTHKDIWKNASYLPCFASPAIESQLHRIPGLSNRFLYLNDDVMFGNDIYPDDFWALDGTQNVFLSWEVPRCADGCPNNWISDGYCDAACNNAACDWDGGDCEPGAKGAKSSGSGGSSMNGGAGMNKGGDGKRSNRYCASGCPTTWVGDKVCDRACQDPACAYDGGDCGLEMMQENHVYGISLDPSTCNNSRFVLDENIGAFYLDFGAIFARKKDDDDDDDDGGDLDVNAQSDADEGQSDGDGNEEDSDREYPKEQENRILSAVHDHPEMVRQSVVTQNEKILAFILAWHEDIPEQEEMTVTVEGVKDGHKVSYIFTIARDSGEKSPNLESLSEKALKALDYICPLNQTSDDDSNNNNNQGSKMNSNNETVALKHGIPSNVTSVIRLFFNATVKEYDNDVQSLIDAITTVRGFGKENTADERDPSLMDGFFKKLLDDCESKVLALMEAVDSNLLISAYYSWLQLELNHNDNNQNHTGESKKNKVEQQKTKLKVNALNLPSNLLRGMGKQSGKNGNGGLSLQSDQSEQSESVDHNGRRRMLLTVDPLFDDDSDNRDNNDDQSVPTPQPNSLKQSLKKEGLMDEELWVLLTDSLRWIDESGHWQLSNDHNDWSFLDDNNHNDRFIPSEQEEEEKTVSSVRIDSYLPSNDESPSVSSDEWTEYERTQIRRIEQRKEKELALMQMNDVKLISQVLRKVFEMNEMEPYPWLIEQLTGYVMYHEALGLPIAESVLVGLQQQYRHHQMMSETDGINRRLLDTFADSLRFVNKLYNKHFGAESRNVPAHMPHAIDKEILIELVHKFAKEFDATSSHRFRSPRDMQWSFSYYYYLMSAKRKEELTLESIFTEELDLDGDGYLNNFEENRLVNEILLPNKDLSASSSNQRGLNDSVWKDFYHRALWNITTQLHDLTYWHPLEITLFTLNYTDTIRDSLMKIFSKELKYLSMKATLDDVEFYMIRDDPDGVKKRLNDMYHKKPKFMCLNDDMDHTKDPSNETMRNLHEFFYKYYPLPSPFEIIEEADLNEHLSVDEMKRQGVWKYGEYGVDHLHKYDDIRAFDKAVESNKFKKHRLRHSRNMNSLEGTTHKLSMDFYTLSSKKNGKGKKKRRRRRVLSTQTKQAFSYNVHYFSEIDEKESLLIDNNNNNDDDGSGLQMMSKYRKTAMKRRKKDERKEHLRRFVYRFFVRFAKRIGWFWSVLLLSVLLTAALFGFLYCLELMYQVVWTLACLRNDTDNTHWLRYLSPSFWKKNFGSKQNKRDD